jgi:hypothetical protein
MPSKRKNKNMVQASMNQLPIGPTNGAPADPKLFHLVKKILNSTPVRSGADLHSDDDDDDDDDDGPNRHRRAPSAASSQPSSLSGSANVNDVVERLRNQHREYLRKDLQRLTLQVETIVQQIQAQTTSSASPSREGQNAGRKRKVCDNPRRLRSDDSNNNVVGSIDDKAFDKDEFGNEVLYEEAALQHDSLQRHVAESIGSGGGGLNAALRNRYLANAQEQRKLAAAVAPSSVSEENPGATENRNAEVATPSAPNDGDAVKSPKLKRKGSKLLKRSSSSGGLAYRSQANAGMFDPSSCAFLVPVPRPPERYRDLGGMDSAIQELRQLVEYPLMRPELYRHLGIDPPRGVLLRGPPGCGKTHFANAGTSFFAPSACSTRTDVILTRTCAILP